MCHSELWPEHREVERCALAVYVFHGMPEPDKHVEASGGDQLTLALIRLAYRMVDERGYDEILTSFRGQSHTSTRRRGGGDGMSTPWGEPDEYGIVRCSGACQHFGAYQQFTRCSAAGTRCSAGSPCEVWTRLLIAKARAATCAYVENASTIAAMLELANALAIGSKGPEDGINH